MVFCKFYGEIIFLLLTQNKLKWHFRASEETKFSFSPNHGGRHFLHFIPWPLPPL